MSQTPAGEDHGAEPAAGPADGSIAGFAAVVVAAGAGTRFGSDRPKGLLELAGQPLVRHATAAMIAAGATRTVVVVPGGWVDRFAEVLAGLPVDAVVVGGRERTHSVRQGLAALDGPGVPPIVLVHDAARPLVPFGVIRRVLATVAAGVPAVVPAVPVTDTIRELSETGSGSSRPLDRSRLRAVQTPQGFQLTVLRTAYADLGDEVVTDDAGVCERAGHRDTVVDGAAEAFKITHPADLALAELVLHHRAPAGVGR